MASRIGSLTDFAPLSPPWLLTQLDQNTTNIAAAFNDSSLGYVNAQATDTGTANNYIVALPYGSPTAYNQGMTVVFTAANTNNSSSTLTVSPLGSVSILDIRGNALVAGAIQVSETYELTYIGTAFRITSGSSGLLVLNTAVTVGGTTNVQCANYSHIAITFDATGAPGSAHFTINLVNVFLGAHIDVLILTAGGSQNFKWSGTDQNTATISPITAYYPIAPSGGGGCTFNPANLITAGDNAGSFIAYSGFVAFKPSISQATEIRFSAMFG